MPWCRRTSDLRPGAARRHRRLHPATLLLSGFLLPVVSGCDTPPSDHGFAIEQVVVRETSTAVEANKVEIVVRQRVTLSREAQEALTHGVPLNFRTEVALYSSGSLFNLAQAARRVELRYLPLSGHYRIRADGGTAQTFPRLRHALAVLAEVTLQLPLPDAADDPVEVRVRSYLDRRLLPTPMRLPTWLSARWVHDSGWYVQPIAVNEAVDRAVGEAVDRVVGEAVDGVVGEALGEAVDGVVGEAATGIGADQPT